MPDARPRSLGDGRVGLPVCRVTADYHDNERKIAAFIQDQMEQWYRGRAPGQSLEDLQQLKLHAHFFAATTGLPCCSTCCAPAAATVVSHSARPKMRPCEVTRTKSAVVNAS